MEEVAVLARGRSFLPKIPGGRRRPPPAICSRLDRPANALQLCRFVADFLRAPLFVFKPHFGGGATYAVHLRFTEKLLVDFLLVAVEELFSLDVTAEALRASIY